MLPATGARLRTLAAFLALAAATALIWGQLAGMHRYSDEAHHMRQIGRFCDGDFTLEPKLAMIPGYHALGALVARAVGDCSLLPMRALNLAYGVLCVLAFYWAALATPTRFPLARTLQFYFLPILLPYHFLVYTDSLALLTVLGSVGFALRRRYALAGLVGALGVFVRQTNVVWLAFLAGYALVEEEEWRHAQRPLLAALRLLKPFLAGAALLAAFVAWNGSLAMANTQAYRAGFYLGNVFFVLFLFFLVFLPHSLARLWRGGSAWGGTALALLLGVAFVAFLASFRIEHAYNRFQGFLRNDLLLAMDARPLLKLAFFVPVAGALAALRFERLQRGAFLLLYPFALLSLISLKLIDQRYAFAPLALFLLFRRDDEPALEAVAVGYAALLSALVLDGLGRGALAL